MYPFFLSHSFPSICLSTRKPPLLLPIPFFAPSISPSTHQIIPPSSLFPLLLLRLSPILLYTPTPLLNWRRDGRCKLWPQLILL